MCPEDEWKQNVNNVLFGNQENGYMGLIQRDIITRTMIEEHIKECKETRRELRGWLMSILAAVVSAAVIFYLRLG